MIEKFKKNEAMLREPRNSNVLVFSIGNPMEAHGPALPYDIDSRIAIRVAVEAADKTGAVYATHIPYTTDRMGEIAKSWCPAYIPVDEFYEKSINQVKDTTDYYQKLLNKDLGIVVVSGHGGIPKEFENVIEERLGFKTRCVFPGEEFGVHAGYEEHSVAAYCGHLFHNGLDLIHDVAKEDPEEVFRRWPVLLGMAGFWLYRGDEFGILRFCSKYSRIEKFRNERKLFVDVLKGRELFDNYARNVVTAIEDMSQYI